MAVTTKTRHPHNWNAFFQWLAPVVMVILIGVLGFWTRTLKSCIRLERLKSMEQHEVEIFTRAAEQFYPMSNGKVISIRVDGVEARLIRIESKQDRIIELLSAR